MLSRRRPCRCPRNEPAAFRFPMIVMRRSLAHERASLSRPADGERSSRRDRLQDNALGMTEDAYVSPYLPAPAGTERHYQLVLPYHGLFWYRVGQSSWLLDSNSLLFISPGWDFRDDHPLPDVGHAALLLTPALDVLEELCAGAGPAAAFSQVRRPASREIRLLASLVRRGQPASSPLRADELYLRVLRGLVQHNAAPPQRDTRIVRRAKEVLHACTGRRLSLSEIAAEVGVSAVYLTQEFGRAEGVPLYQYQLALRLNRALGELCECDDITALALDLGFSSHSHFTSAFRSHFGLTPSDYRAANARTIMSALS